MALDFAPRIVSISRQLCFPIQKPRRAGSVALLSSGTSPSSRNTRRYLSWFMEYVRAFLSGILAGLRPGVFLPMQNRRQPAVSAPAVSDAAVPQAPGLQARCQVYIWPRSVSGHHTQAFPYVFLYPCSFCMFLFQ